MTRSSSFHQALNSSPKLFQIHNICIFSKCNCRSSSRFGALKGFGSVGRSSFLPLFVGEKEEEEEEEADSGLGRGRDRVRSLVQCGGEGGGGRSVRRRARRGHSPERDSTKGKEN